MSIKQWNSLLVLALVVVLAGGAYWLYATQEKQAEHSEQAVPVTEATVAAAVPSEDTRKPDQTALLKDIEDELNGVIAEVNEEAQSYKARRKVMLDLIRPANLRAPDYIAENYKIAETTDWELQMQMEHMMAVFSNADVKMKQAIFRLTPDEQSQSITRWKSIHGSLASQYIEFFSGDQIVFAKIKELLGYYYTHRNELDIDVPNNRIVFEDAEKQAEAFRINKEIRDVMKIQRAAAQPQT